ALPYLHELYNAFYPNDTKVLPMSLLIFMDAVTLAHWIMCDGYNESNCGLVLCTDNFTMQEVCTLIGFLHYNFGFNFLATEKGHHIIYITAASMSYLCSLVGPHMHPHFMYKIRTS
ncbi:LAGLIDADG DNA endonuclease, partial [Laetiporus sulphureus 93-53]